MSSIKEVQKILEQMFLYDQKIRSKESNDAQIEKADSEHRVKFKELFSEWGLITKSVFGSKAAHYAWLLVQHFPEDELQFMDEYLRLMKSNPDEVDQKDTAFLEDRVNMYKGLPQIFGTQFKWSEKIKKYELWPIKDESTIDELRKNVGLEPLERYIKKFYS